MRQTNVDYSTWVGLILFSAMIFLAALLAVH